MRHLLTAHQQESSLPFSSWQSLSCCLSRVAKRSTPKPHGPLFSPQNRMVLSLLHQSCLILALFLSPQNLAVLSSFTSEPHGPLSIYLLQNLVVLPFTSEPHGLLLPPPKPCGPPPSMTAAPRFKSQRPSSFAAPFLTPPTISYTC